MQEVDHPDFSFFFKALPFHGSTMSWFSSAYLPTPVVLVAIGGAAGSVLRYSVGRALVSFSDRIPSLWGTCMVNIAGSFILGCVVAGFGTSHRAHPGILLLGVGLCGGFTTFSTFAMELSELINSRRWDLAVSYGLGSLVCGWLAFVGGAWILQRLSQPGIP